MPSPRLRRVDTPLVSCFLPTGDPHVPTLCMCTTTAMADPGRGPGGIFGLIKNPSFVKKGCSLVKSVACLEI